jgi:hypothetical protein
MTNPNQGITTPEEHLMPILVTEKVPYLGDVALSGSLSGIPEYVPEDEQ